MFSKGDWVRLKADKKNIGRVHIVSTKGTYIRLDGPGGVLSGLLHAEDFETVPPFEESAEITAHRERAQRFEELKRRGLTIFTDEEWAFLTTYYTAAAVG